MYSCPWIDGAREFARILKTSFLFLLNFLILDMSLAVYVGATSLLITCTLFAIRTVLRKQSKKAKLERSVFKLNLKTQWNKDETWEARVSCMRVFSTLMTWSNGNKSCMRVDQSWQVKVCMSAFSTLMSWSNENKSYMRVDESWQARVCMRVFSTLMSWSNENKCCMRVDESWQAKVCMRVFSTLMSWSNENKSCMRVEKRDFVWEFSQLSCPGQTKTRVAWELMRVEKREFV